MRRLGICFLILVCVLSLLTGCNGVVPQPPEPPEEEIPLELIREYTGRDNVARWRNGTVFVCDITDNTKDIWEKINKAIGGPVVFKLTDDREAKIGIEFVANSEFPYFSGIRINNFVFSSYGVGIHPTIKLGNSEVFTQICLEGAGIKREKAAEGLSPSVKKVLYWLYRLEPGFSLI